MTPPELAVPFPSLLPHPKPINPSTPSKNERLRYRELNPGLSGATSLRADYAIRYTISDVSAVLFDGGIAGNWTDIEGFWKEVWN
jgi:hypothetical protein